MQETIVSNIRIVKLVYYAAAIVFHLVLLFTNVGNYFHSGNFFELVAIQTAAVLIAATAFKLLPKVGPIEKILIGLSALIPSVSIIWSLISVLTK
jgi:uncharacterized membrane protein